MLKLEVTPAAAFTEYNELNFQGLYLHHMYKGPNANQIEIVADNAQIGIGATVVNNWEVYDGPGPDANLVARAQGLHTHAGNNCTWVNYFSLVFVNEKFRGSTLEVMGKLAVENGDWAVVGGTGQFAMANGVISKRLHEEKRDGNIMELTIRAFCPVINGTCYPVVTEGGGGSLMDITEIPRQPESTVPEVTKLGPFGGSGGSLMDITETPRRLESITVRVSGVVDSITFSYIDNSGQKHSAGPWGGRGGSGPHNVQLKESEVVTKVSGTFKTYNNNKSMITSIKFFTNLNNKPETWGNQDGDSFAITAPPGTAIVGFFVFVLSAKYLKAIGAYVRPL